MSKQEEDNMQREFKKIVDGIIAFNNKVGGHLPNIAMSINSSLFNYMNSKEMERQVEAAKIEADLANLDVSDSDMSVHQASYDKALEDHYQDMADHQEEIEEACKPEE